MSEAAGRSAQSAVTAQEEQARAIAKLEGQIAAEHAKHAAHMAQHADEEAKTKAAQTSLAEVTHPTSLLLGTMPACVHSVQRTRMLVS